MSTEGMDEVVQEFLVESAENLDQLDIDLVALEGAPGSRELLSSVFRAVHTIKGTTGFLGFGRLEQVAHVAENLLSRLRDGVLQMDAARTTALLDVVDAMRGLLGLIEATGSDEDERDLSELVERLTVLLEPGEAVASAPPGASMAALSDLPAWTEEVAVDGGSAAEADVESPRSAVDDGAGPLEAESVTDADGAGLDVVLVESARVELDQPAPEASAAPTSRVTPKPVPVIADLSTSIRAAAAPVEPDTDRIEVPAPKQAPGESAEGKLSASERSVRVDVELLDALMRQVGELVLARNQVISHVDDLANTSLVRTVQRLSLIVSELQEDVMKTRMQPVEQLWSKLPRVVRDLSAQFKKQINLHLEGGETELDRSLLEAMRDPLTHLIRNAVDHGIESPERRAAAGKNPVGTVVLRAFHEGGQVVLEMTDDGGGIDPAVVGARAVERGLITEGQLATMSARDVVDLIFLPGFSTAATVTNVSGRGVGMDVVRTNIERIGGTVDVLSTPGVRTTFRVKIPLTLAIIPALLVGCGANRYAIPQASVQELVRLNRDQANSGIERVDQTLVYRLRGRLLPLVRLEEIFKVPVEPIDARAVVDIAVVQAEGQLFGIIVDRVYGTQEIVVKPLGRQLSQLTIYSGATILGDGGVAVILDIPGLADASHIREGRVAAAIALEGEQAEHATDHELLLLVRAGAARRAAIPLSWVSRLEEVDADSIEHAGTRRVIQYRGDFLPLIWLSDLIGVPGDSAGHPKVSVAVCSDGQRTVGLVVDEILDVTDESVTLDTVGASAAVLGTVVLQQQAADLLDVSAVFGTVGEGTLGGSFPSLGELVQHAA